MFDRANAAVNGLIEKALKDGRELDVKISWFFLSVRVYEKYRVIEEVRVDMDSGDVKYYKNGVECALPEEWLE